MKTTEQKRPTHEQHTETTKTSINKETQQKNDPPNQSTKKQTNNKRT